MSQPSTTQGLAGCLGLAMAKHFLDGDKRVVTLVHAILNLTPRQRTAAQRRDVGRPPTESEIGRSIA
jgi:hypothetical protein